MPKIPFTDIGLKWFKDIVNKVIDWFGGQISSGLRNLTNDFFGTPLPEGSGTDVIFNDPGIYDEPWHTIYEAVVGGEVMMLSLLILFVIVQGRHTARIFNFGSAYEARRTKRSAWTGAVLIVGWYWVAVMLLYFVDALTIALIPDLTLLGNALLSLLPGAVANPGLTLIMATVGGLAMVALKAVYFVRELLLYVYLYSMPFGFAIAFGNLPVVSTIAKRWCRQFVPLAMLPLPAALLFRGYGLLFAAPRFVTPAGAFLKYFAVISLPLLALYVTWKTFQYASPLTAQALGGATRVAATAGTVAAAGYAGGQRAAVTAARWGPRAGATHLATQRFADDQGTQGENGAPDSTGQTNHDNIATDRGGVAAYRRSENDPAYY